jgi:hypothetical protein
VALVGAVLETTGMAGTAGLSECCESCCCVCSFPASLTKRDPCVGGSGEEGEGVAKLVSSRPGQSAFNQRTGGGGVGGGGVQCCGVAGNNDPLGRSPLLPPPAPNENFCCCTK